MDILHTKNTDASGWESLIENLKHTGDLIDEK
jgi:hypothetical protein